MFQKIPGNVRRDSGECSRRFRGMLNKIPRIVGERGTECRECGECGECSRGFRGISYRIPGNVIILTTREMFQKIPGNVEEDSGEYSRGFRGMFQKIPGNVQEDSGECCRRFRGMLNKIPRIVGKDSRKYQKDCTLYYAIKRK